jgi:alpha-tubulin suppressor-like RCC1 family protein
MLVAASLVSACGWAIDLGEDLSSDPGPPQDGTGDGSVPALLGSDSGGKATGDAANDTGENGSVQDGGEDDASRDDATDGPRDAGPDAPVDGAVSSDSGGSDGAIDGAIDAAVSSDSGGFDGGFDAAVEAGFDGGPVLFADTPTIAVGTVHSCALVGERGVKCWGTSAAPSGASGMLGLEDRSTRGNAAGQMGSDLPFVPVAPGRTPRAVAAGWDHTCVLFDDEAVRCWGENNSGRLGLEDSDDRGVLPGDMGTNLPAVNVGTGARVRGIAAGKDHTCALLVDGQLKCWGANAKGQLGQSPAFIGDRRGSMGDALRAVNLGTRRTAKFVAAGYEVTCAILDDDALKCWGNNWRGVRGFGGSLPIGRNAGEMGDALPAVNLGTGRRARHVAIALEHACAALDDGSVKCWGGNNAAALGLGGIIWPDRRLQDMGDALPVVNLGTGAKAVAVTVGTAHSCALLEGGAVKCWGRGSALGLGTNEDVGDDIREMGDALPAVELGGRAVEIVTRENHTCARLEGGAVKCWGANGSGQLGLGDTRSRGARPGEMGGALPVVELGR